MALTDAIASISPGRAAQDPTPFVRCRDGQNHLDLIVTGMHCAACIARIERAMMALPGVTEARVNLSTGKLRMAWTAGRLQPSRIIEAIETLGFEAKPFDAEPSATRDSASARLMVPLGVTAFASMNIMLLSISVWGDAGEMGAATRSLHYWISALIAIPATIYGGLPFYRSAWSALRKGHANMDVPISIGVLGTLAISIWETALGGEHAYFEAAVTLLFLLLIGRVLDLRLRDQARAAARDLIALQAGIALRLDGGDRVAPISAREIEPGDRLLLMPGDRLLADAVVLEGEGQIDRSLVTGESTGLRAGIGDSLRAGERSLDARLILRATHRAEDSLLAELTRLVEAGEQRRAHYVRLADRAAQIYVPLVHTLAALTLAIWLLAGAEARDALMAAVAVLIITCPCALGLAVPAVQVVATGRLFRSGILVKSGDALEQLARIDTVLLDKTGTLTLGRPELLNAAELLPDKLARAAALARLSRHPLSRALAKAMGPGPVATAVTETAGEGLEGFVDGHHLRLGRATFVGVEPSQDAVGTELWVREDDAAPMRLLFADQMRPDAIQAIARLKTMGLSIEMLSGDRPEPARLVAQSLGISAWQSAMTPNEKAERVAALRAKGAKILMVGDGLNDTPALTGADVGISFGSAADASQSAAGLVIQGDALMPLADAIEMARKAEARVLENFGFSALYNVVAIPLAMLGGVTPLIAAIAMSASSLVVSLNALRLLDHKKG